MSLILIVDDTEDNREVLAGMLTAKGYQTQIAVDGMDALDMVEKQLPDLILLDVGMPRMNGYQVARHLKDHEHTCHIPIIFISSQSGVEDKVKAFEVGGVDYITKPFQLLEVLARVESQLMMARQRKEIQALSAHKDELIRIVSHDLQNPIGIISGYVHLLIEEIQIAAPEAPHLLSWLETVSHTSDYMFSIVENLLDVARIERGLPLLFKVISVNELLEETFRSFQLMAHEKDIQFDFIPLAEDVQIKVDKSRIQQVIHNLLSNSIKYTPLHGEISLVAHIEDASLVIDITDTGLGIPESDLPHIFEQFYRINTIEHREAKGTGLGLTVAKGIVDQHGGDIVVSSHVGEGSVFSVSLPLDRQAVLSQ